MGMSAIDGSMNLATMNARSAVQGRSLEAGLNPRDVGEIKKAAEEFESIFMELMLKAMRDTVPKEGLTSGGNAEDVYRGMLDSEYAKVMAGQHSSGLAETITRQLLESMGKQAGKPANLAGHQAYQRQAETGALQDQAKQGTIGDGAR
jgi:peptidoglycan hydrolase FlgJ